MGRLTQIRNSISPDARVILTKMDHKQGRAEERIYASESLDTDHPNVEKRFLQAIHKCNPRFVLYWELQVSGEHRWHVKLHRTDSLTDTPEHVLLLLFPEGDVFGEYVPIDHRTVARLEQIMIWSQDPVQFFHDLMDENKEAKRRKDAEYEQAVLDWGNYYRRLFARLADNTPDCRWSPGISKLPSGGYEAGQAPVSRHITKAV